MKKKLENPHKPHIRYSEYHGSEYMIKDGALYQKPDNGTEWLSVNLEFHKAFSADSVFVNFMDEMSRIFGKTLVEKYMKVWKE